MHSSGWGVEWTSWRAISSLRVLKCSYSYVKQKQSQKEGASCRLFSLPSFIKNPVTSESGEPFIRGEMKPCLLQRLTPWASCWQTANSTWHCSLLSSHKAPEREGASQTRSRWCVTVWKQFRQYLEKLQQLKKFCSSWKHCQVLILLFAFCSCKAEETKESP